jgi:hypothetical protein
LEALPAIDRGFHLIPVPTQKLRHDAAQLHVIIDDQNFLRHGASDYSHLVKQELICTK